MFTRVSTLVNTKIHSFTFEENVAIERHRDVHGSKIRHLAQTPYSLPYWESDFYYAKLRKHLNCLNRQTRILDIGCGDGRFTMLLLDMGFTDIYALDANIDSLIDIDKQLIGRGAAEHVVLIHASACDLPFHDGFFGAALSIGVLYYLNENYEEALTEIGRCLGRNSILLETEPDQIGNAVKALVFDGLERFIKVIKDKEFYEFFEGKPLPLRCFSDSEMYELHSTAGFSVTNVEPISLFASLLTIARKRNMIPDIDKLDELRDQVAEAFDYCDQTSTLAKHKLWVCRKN